MPNGAPKTLKRAKPATTTTLGPVLQAATQANSVAGTVAALVTDHNALLAKLKAAGLMASS